MKKVVLACTILIVAVILIINIDSICRVLDINQPCSFENCQTIQIANSDFCSEHTCAFDACNALTYVEEGSVYCRAHTCTVSNCTNSKNATGKYCSTHKCSFYNCNNQAVTGSVFCTSHICQAPDCMNAAKTNSRYCNDHICHYKEYSYSTSKCTYPVVDGGQYCSKHTCASEGCFQQCESSTSYCFSHNRSMRDVLANSYFSFTLNSAGGIKFRFNATNKSGKTIKYIRFDAELYNAVGDRIRADIGSRSYISVEIIGPISPNGRISYSDTIGYCDDLWKLVIRDITLVYTDGTTEKGYFNYNTTKY